MTTSGDLDLRTAWRGSVPRGKGSIPREVIASRPDQVIVYGSPATSRAGCGSGPAHEPASRTHRRLRRGPQARRSRPRPRRPELLRPRRSRAVRRDRRHALRGAPARVRRGRHDAGWTTTGVDVQDASEAIAVAERGHELSSFDRSPVSAGRDAGALAAEHLAKARANRGSTSGGLTSTTIAALWVAWTSTSGGTAADMPTDQRVAKAGVKDPAPRRASFQYGRYLLIASSRPGTQAANLQGIWNDSVRPPWSSNWTLEHQRRDELLAGRDHQPGGAARAADRVSSPTSR